MLRKMYLVSPDYVSHHPPPALPTPSPQQPKAAMSRNKKQRQHVTKQKMQHPHDKWVELKRKIEEADVNRKRLIENIATFLQSVLPYGGTPPALQSMPPPITPDVQPSVISEAPDTPSPSLTYLFRARESLFAAPIKRSLSMESDEGEACYGPRRCNCKGIQ